MVGISVVGVWVVGDSVVGDSVVGGSVVGISVVGDSVVGDSVVGDSVVGDSVVGSCVVGSCVVGGSVVVWKILQLQSNIKIFPFWSITENPGYCALGNKEKISEISLSGTICNINPDWVDEDGIHIGTIDELIQGHSIIGGFVGVSVGK